MSDDVSQKYWYNLKTHEVEHGFQSSGYDRAGPFDTAEEAARAPEIIKERSRAWARDEAEDEGWAPRSTGDSDAGA